MGLGGIKTLQKLDPLGNGSESNEVGKARVRHCVRME
jgi:hypothetical protein